MTAVLSIVATIIAITSLVITLRREWLDRPKLHLSANPTTDPSGNGEIVAIIENHGRQPALVKGVGFEWKIEAGSLPSADRGHILFTDPWSRVRIEPGGHHEVRWTPDRLHCHADTPMVAFAEFGSGRKIWTTPLDALRLLLVMGWQPAKVPPEEWLAAPEARPLAKPVISRWKVWRPKYLRESTPAPVFDKTAEEIAEIRRRLIEESAESPPEPPHGTP
jgi:hypothetical protein